MIVLSTVLVRVVYTASTKSKCKYELVLVALALIEGPNSRPRGTGFLSTVSR